MLYKKCHRNFVKQFKVGTKIKVHYRRSTRTSTFTVLREPYIDLYSIDFYHSSWILIEDDFTRELIYTNGKLRKDIEIVG